MARHLILIGNSVYDDPNYPSLNFVRNDIEKSLFTECIMNALESGEADYTGSGYVTMDNLWTYINSNFDKNIQVPRDFRNGEGSIYISRIPEGKKEDKLKDKVLKESKNQKEIEIRDKRIEDLERQSDVILNEKVKMQKEIELWKLKFIEIEKQKKVEISEKEIIVRSKNTKLVQGGYVQFGKYYNESILWKCMKNDENGYLLVSEYIICLKAFDSAKSGNFESGKNDVEMYGSNVWENSNLREWLNSNEKKVKYKTQSPTKNAVSCNSYDNESGFLTNFNSDDIDKIGAYKHDDISDKIFILSKGELETLWNGKKNRVKQLTKLAAEKSDFKSDYIVENGKYWYWTCTPSPDSSYGVCNVGSDGSFYYWDDAYYGDSGVVPALYLKSDICESGKGSKEEPYIV